MGKVYSRIDRLLKLVTLVQGRRGLAEAPGGDGRKLNDLSKRLLGQRLVPDDSRTRPATLSLPDDADRVTRWYTRRSRVWASTTPVILPGFNTRGRAASTQHTITPTQPVDDLTGSQRKAHKLLLKTLAEAGIPAEAVEEVFLQLLPLWPNLPRAHDYKRPRHLSDRPPYHVRLTFKQPVHGPITLGAGRFIGLGTFAAIPEV